MIGEEACRVKVLKYDSHGVYASSYEPSATVVTGDAIASFYTNFVVLYSYNIKDRTSAQKWLFNRISAYQPRNKALNCHASLLLLAISNVYNNIMKYDNLVTIYCL